MHKYQDVPMDLADASLVAAADLKAAIALNPKKYQEDIRNGVGKGNRDNTGIKIAINLAGLHQEGKITKEIAIAIIERFISNCENSHEMKSATEFWRSANSEPRAPIPLIGAVTVNLDDLKDDKTLYTIAENIIKMGMQPERHDLD